MLAVSWPDSFNLRRLSVLFFVLSGGAGAAIVKAASCSQADVQIAVNAAASGDTIVVPAGTCNYTTGVNFSNKSLTIEGQTVVLGTPPTVGGATDLTIIQDHTRNGNGVFRALNSSPHFVTVKGFTFNPSGTQSSGSVQFVGPDIGNFDVTFRLTGNHFVQSGSRGFISVGTYGLVDHNLFEAPTVSVQSVSIHGSVTGRDMGFTPWTKPFTAGTKSAVYLEDNTFNYCCSGEDAIDAYDGARLVIRHNNFINSHQGFHGTDSGGRSTILWEIYQNTYNNALDVKFDMATIRGGTGFVWGNTYNGKFANVALKLYRACPKTTYGAWGTCDGTHWGLKSLNHSSDLATSASTAGPAFWCSQDRDLQCTKNSDCGTGNTCSAFMDATSGAAGYPCRDQPGYGPHQVLHPVYAWGNNGGNGIIADNTGQTCGVGIGNYIAANRDYYNFNASFTGASGTGQGLLSARPATCTPLVGYYATDNTTFYQCTSTNTWTKYYVPYTYPHPLQGAPPATSLSPASIGSR